MTSSVQRTLLIIGIVAFVVVSVWLYVLRRSPSVRPEAQPPAKPADRALPVPAAGASRYRVAMPGEPLESALADLCRQAGVTLTIVGRSERTAAACDETKLSAAVQAVAGRQSPVAGYLGKLDDGSVKQVFLTRSGIYVGTNKEVARLMDELGAENAETRAEAAHNLGLHDDQMVEPVLARSLLDDPEPDVRSAAADSLEGAQLDSTFNALIRALSDRDTDVREHARASLGLTRDERVHQALLKARQNTTDPAVRAIMNQILERVFNEDLEVE